MDEKPIDQMVAEYKIECPSCGVRLAAKPKLAGRNWRARNAKSSLSFPRRLK